MVTAAFQRQSPKNIQNQWGYAASQVLKKARDFAFFRHNISTSTSEVTSNGLITKVCARKDDASARTRAFMRAVQSFLPQSIVQPLQRALAPAFVPQS